jgi:hypothetical protein
MTKTVNELHIKGTPLWKYLRGYYIRQKTNQLDAERYLRNEVPQQLQQQVKDTLKRMRSKNETRDK